jgi:hypothetical protein
LARFGKLSKLSVNDEAALVESVLFGVLVLDEGVTLPVDDDGDGVVKVGVLSPGVRLANGLGVYEATKALSEFIRMPSFLLASL